MHHGSGATGEFIVVHTKAESAIRVARCLSTTLQGSMLRLLCEFFSVLIEERGPLGVDGALEAMACRCKSGRPPKDFIART